MKQEPLAPFACCVCYMPSTASLRFDKHGNPFVSCIACGLKMFCKSPNSIQGIFSTARLVEAVIRQVKADPQARAARERQTQEDVRAVRVHMATISATRAADEPQGAQAQESNHGTVRISEVKAG